MMGKSHIIANLCSIELLWAAGRALDRYEGYGSEYVGQAMEMAASYLGPQGGVPAVIYGGTAAGLFLFGTLLPDIDSRNSILGRYVRLPFHHRTWIHAVYIPILIFVASIWYHALFWLGLGYVLHLFWDSLSGCGNCWFYKLLSDYREYPSGAKVKRGHRLKLYKAGKTSEYVLLGVLVTASVLTFLLTVWLDHGMMA